MRNVVFSMKPPGHLVYLQKPDFSTVGSVSTMTVQSILTEHFGWKASGDWLAGWFVVSQFTSPKKLILFANWNATGAHKYSHRLNRFHHPCIQILKGDNIHFASQRCSYYSVFMFK